MKYLLDASVLLPLVTRRGRRLIIDASRESLATTDLAIYEVCNGLWKLSKILKTISLEESLNIATVLKELTVRNLIHVASFAELDLAETLKKACEEHLTFYDASYITIAEKAGATLVTEDEELIEKAGRFVKTITYTDLEERLT